MEVWNVALFRIKIKAYCYLGNILLYIILYYIIHYCLSVKMLINKERKMKHLNTFYILEIILCILVLVSLYLISHFVYIDAFNIRFVSYILGNWIIISIIDWKKQIGKTPPKVRWFTFLLITVTILIFVIYKPDISYKKGKEIVIAYGYDNIYELQNKSIASFQSKTPPLVPYAYLYAGEKSNVKYYVLLSPINGEIKTEKIGGGNSLDLYFEMRYGK